MQLLEKQDIIKEHQMNDKDTGSVEVQVAILTKRINHLTEHLKTSPKDHSSRRGLIMMVGKRRRLLDYLNRISSERYESLIGKLELRK